MRGPSDFIFNGKEAFKKRPPKESPTLSEDSSGHPGTYKEALGQIEKKMELQINKIFDRISEVRRDLEYRMRNVKKHVEATEARVEELSIQLNMLRAKQDAAEYNARARNQNTTVTSKEMFLCPLRNPETNEDVYCPATLEELESYRGSQLDALLRDLGEPIPTALKHKMEVIKWALGIRNANYK
ncbi:uncharacterized protein TrAtP1_003515 [Trichoderma atroviride]|uniref:Uncharacterized protein n=1 Tax=Hypocrea atroviridis (strain ATCC 20476 / IMI 206040) TaxID=452589 RepID=G9NWA0_HYPAI|nr:uncharacterized protein TRIATDRAFT_87848 [Trichoderma atroviride IMI 206040]EHK45262.1 hypothetical protein TRIATDRAFT_87848 [Trichoderma atroviride IMI 206040]UKZ62263.1 hypothetical protein TrAtP1_003515 [Trichoderma atroviride]